MTMRLRFALTVVVCAALLSSRPALAQFAQQGPKLVGTGAVGQASQGSSVALSADGNTAIAGGQFDNNSVGAAWIWTRSGGNWNQQGAKLVGSGPIGTAQQGSAVALSADGNTAIVGGYRDNGDVGAAWVWTRVAGVWTQQGSKLVGSGSVGAAFQGGSVSLSADGDTAIVGGHGDNGSAGAAWIWVRIGGVWSQQGGKLIGSAASADAIQGISVSLSADGNTAIIGGSNDNGHTGAAWIWTRSGGVWTQQGNKLVGSGIQGSASSQQGHDVALSADGNTAIVGGYSDNEFAGAAWVWSRSGGVWTQQGPKLVGSGAIGSAGQGLSLSLSADGNIALIGGPIDNSSVGAAWVLTRSGGVWTQQGSKLVGSGAVGSAGQGLSLSLSADGSTAILGGSTDNNLHGAVWIFAAPDLTITKNHGGVFRQGDSGDAYTISVTNSGAASTTATVTVSDTLPSGLNPTSPNGLFNGWSCLISGQTLTCTRSDALASGASYPPITTTVNVSNNAPANVTNTAMVSGGGEVNVANDAASDLTTIVQVPDLSITKAVVGTPPFGAGANRTYIISVVNNGPGSASGVVVTDTLPSGTAFISSTPSQGSCSGTTTVTCVLGALVSGGSATISLVLKTSSTPGAVVNTATVSAAESELNMANNSATSTITTVDPAQLPAVSEWALITMAGVLAMLGAFRART